MKQKILITIFTLFISMFSFSQEGKLISIDIKDKEFEPVLTEVVEAIKTYVPKKYPYFLDIEQNKYPQTNPFSILVALFDDCDDDHFEKTAHRLSMTWDAAAGVVTNGQTQTPMAYIMTDSIRENCKYYFDDTPHCLFSKTLAALVHEVYGHLYYHFEHPFNNADHFTSENNAYTQSVNILQAMYENMQADAKTPEQERRLFILEHILNNEKNMLRRYSE
ncbi:hypothetical protein Emin_0650 [Elusimicrobium minutum Pei191]|uniref:Uncharacterized protein n=1 Tax=Elusimicrobium minutum (strain Pei191) TaxID=445932 RepID=B2KC78_ELUMP|nr:hypothetical protein [Elusimicrobium minutum]ACC98205.1 hypothetical protein Emin_0650 [Elusimicrobium minutum Pei191]